ncbi:cullin-3A [Trifolium repens]|nr:cullin-3A [Trifolium repens]
MNKKKFEMLPKFFKYQVNAEETWKILEQAIHQIYNHNESDLKFEELYRIAYNMVLDNYGDKLYFGLVATITYHLKEIATSIEATQGDSFLEELNSKWNHHHKSLEHIRAILMYMERIYVPKAEKKPIYELGLNLWTENVICSEQIKTRLSNTLLDLVRKDRAGEDVNKELIRNITKMLMDLGSSVYKQEFESIWRILG